MFNSMLCLTSQADLLFFVDWKCALTKERTQELFWKYVRETSADERLPVVHLDRYTFFFYEVASLVFCLTTGENPSPSSALEFLKGFTMLLNSILGTLTEEKMRANLHLVLEALSECCDYGVPQDTDVTKIRDRLQSIVLQPKFSTGRTFGGKVRAGMFRSVLDTQSSGQEEVFLDMVEQASCTVNARGDLTVAHCSGTLQMKSFIEGNLSAVIKMHAFSAEAIRDTHPSVVGSAAVLLEDFKLHEDATLLETLDDKGYAQVVVPSTKGERVIMTYSLDLLKSRPELPLTADVRVERDPEGYHKKAVVTVHVQCQVSDRYGAQTVKVQLPMPRFVTSVSCSSEGVSKMAKAVHEWDSEQSTLTWRVTPNKSGKLSMRDIAVQGKTSIKLVAKAMLSKPFDTTFQRNLGPVNLSYTLHNVGLSGMKICFLDLEGWVPRLKGDTGPGKWLRTITTSNSTTFRI